MLKRDFGILFLAACAVFLSIQNEGPFTFEKAWYHHFSSSEVKIADSSTYADLPPPVSADLNGDGKPEILTATPGGILLVLAPRRHGDGFAPALVLSELNLGTLLDFPEESVSIKALISGYIAPRPSDLVHSLRKQVVVVVTAAGHVLVLDHNLKLMWKQSLQDHMPDDGELKEVAIIITEHAATKNDRGLIVIGARAEPDTLADDIEEDDLFDEEILAEKLQRLHEHGRSRSDELDEVGGDGGASGRHFSYFAYSGDAGVLRWKHEALDFHRDLAGLQESTVTTQHSLHAAAQLQEGVHYGEASCRDFREAVLASLPHSWHTERDTGLHLAHFHRHRAHRGAQREQISTLGIQRQQVNKQPNLNSLNGPPVPAGTFKNQQRPSHYAPPNVIVAHMEEGIEAVHLFSGRTVCRLFLDPYALHVDLNGDGIPDHVHAVGGDAMYLAEEAALEDADLMHAHHRLRFCAAVVTSGIPPKQPLFNGTICRPVRFGLERARKLGYIEVTPPISLPVPGRGGHYRQQILRQKSIAVFLTSRGDLTAYSSNGDLLWQEVTSAYWKTDAFISASDVTADGDDATSNSDAADQENEEEEEHYLEAQPTLKAMALRRHAVPSVILAAGDDMASIISEHGNEMASFDLPERPTQPLTAVDFNIDSYTDIVMIGRDGLYGWAQVRRPGAVPFSALVGVLIVIMLTVFVMQQGFMQPEGRKAKGRSTDRVD